MADDKDKNKPQYSYRPDIQYQDTYESDYKNKHYQTVQVQDKDDDEKGKEIMDSITNVFNDVSKIVPLLPVDLQTAINNVYKPILDDWDGIRKKPYPITIPDPDKIIYDPKTIIYPYGKPFEYDIDVDGPGPIPYYPAPTVYPPDDPPSTEPSVYDPKYVVDNDRIWDGIVPINITFSKVDPVEVIEKELIKNIADLYNYYANRLKDILYHYYSEKLMSAYSKKKDADGNLINKTIRDLAFLTLPITDSCSSVTEDCKHLFDASLAMGEKTRLKLYFMQNAFPLEQTLFHLKNFKTIYELRLRYEKIELSEGKDKTDAMSNNILKGMKTSYDQKYDVSFMNLYKYLNSSLDILQDTVNTELAGIKARKTLLEKGGITK